MASPTLDLLCCSFFHIANKTNFTDINPAQADINPNETNDNPAGDNIAMIKKYFYLYNSTVIAISAFSVIGAVYMLFLKKRQTAVVVTTRPGLMEMRQKWIVFWLSFADIMACLGLIVLSSESMRILIISDNGVENLSSSSWEWLCIIATAWIHFFFFATYVWITCYAIDVYMFLTKTAVRNLLKVYFVISWLLPIIFISFGLWALYKTSEPVMACSTSKNDDLLRVYYLCLFVPMIIVLIVNPIIYFMAGKKVSPLLRGRGMYTDREREIESQVRKKFLKIVIVMEVCWLPNVVNGILLLSDVRITMRGGYPIVWIFMAILNPLQAFLNTMVYWGPTGCASISFRGDSITDAREQGESNYLRSHPPWRDAAVPSDTETQPLLRGRAKDTLN